MAEPKPRKPHRLIGPTEILFLLGLVAVFSPFVMPAETDSRIRVGLIALGLAFMVATAFVPGSKKKPKR